MAVQRWRWEDPAELPRNVVSNGGILAIPTESSYGLAVDPRSRGAVNRVFALKGRPADKPLPVVAGSLEQLDMLGVNWRSSPLRPLIALWPAALSLLLPLRKTIPASGGETTLVVRIPDHPRLRSLLLALGTPLTATSANPSAESPLVDPDEVERMLEGTDSMIVDDGQLPGGLPSTIVGWEDGDLKVLRRGRYPLDRVQACLDRATEVAER